MNEGAYMLEAWLNTGMAEPYAMASTVWTLQLSADAGGAYPGTEGQTITLDGSGSTGNIVSYEWDVEDDGVYDYSSASASQSHTYAQQGTYSIRLKVTDSALNTSEAVTTANIIDTSPSADFSGSPLTGNSPLTVNFTNSSAGYDSPLTYEWDFDNNGSTDSTLQNPSHNYGTPGTYSVKLKVTDSDGSTDTLTRTAYITVNEALYTLTVNVTGSGTITSQPIGINCGSDCDETYTDGTVVNLTAEPSDGFIFTGWGGDADCSDGSVSMSSAKTCSASFEACSSRLVKLDGSSPPYYNSIQDAYIAAGNNDIIMVQAETFTADLNINLPKSVTILGGYNCEFSSVSGITTVNGNLSVTDGTLTIESVLFN